jgi:DNA helicase-2/ATP-dependent DNA helicase PcrA
MTGRSRQKDTEADISLQHCLNAKPPQSFLMVAGAGSGKTTSLIKGLTEAVSKHGSRLSLKRQKIACITYTEVAAEEIWGDVGKNPLVHVSTIHSFLWLLIRGFQSDIREWVDGRIDEKIAELKDEAAKFSSRVRQRTRDKNQRDTQRYAQQKLRIASIRSFTYGTGSDYGSGILGHDDIIKMVPKIISERPLMRRLLAQQYPFVFVDESQDTAENVVAALKLVAQEMAHDFCLGFFGDPMQHIYQTGIGKIKPEPGWADITKPENFRCPLSIMAVANAIRHDGDGLVQIRGKMVEVDGAQVPVQGSARLFILSTDVDRDDRIRKVRKWVAEKNDDPQWANEGDIDAIKVLIIVHRMAAKRLGFEELYAALNDKAPEKFKSGFLDGSSWPLRPFTRFVMPLVVADARGDEFEVIQILRKQSPLMKRDNLAGVDVAKRLGEIRNLTKKLQAMMQPGSGETCGAVLRLIHDAKVVKLDPRVLAYLDLPEPEPEPEENTNEAKAAEEQEEEELTKEISAMDAFLACPASQFKGYYRYVNDVSPFSTHQGIKGAEFERVLVVLDDEEGTHFQFSYEKYLGMKPLSDRESENAAEGKETTIERTRRLFYVCCTRAMRDLVVVFFTSDVAKAKAQVEHLGLFPAESIYLENDLEGL